MRTKSRVVSAVIAVLALATSGTAFARATLLSSTPAANATASGVRSLTLNFSERVVEKLSNIEIVMTAMPGMSHHRLMKIAGFKTALSADGKAMLISLPRALPAGQYQVTWHAVSGDSERAEGSYNFSAKYQR